MAPRRCLTVDNCRRLCCAAGYLEMTEDFTADIELFFPIPNPNRDPYPSLPTRYPAPSRLVAIGDDHAIWSATPHLYASLLLAALGAGGILPCVVAFGAEQFPAKERKKPWSFFNWYYFCMGTTMVVAVTAVVYVQDNVGWGWGWGSRRWRWGSHCIKILQFLASDFANCHISFGAEQFPEEERKKTWSFFNWYYFALISILLLAVGVHVYSDDVVLFNWNVTIGRQSMVDYLQGRGTREEGLYRSKFVSYKIFLNAMDNKPLRQVQFVFLPCHIPNSGHWLLLVCDIEMQQLIAYDSLYDPRHREVVKEQVGACIQWFKPKNRTK
ncbi:Peptide transporter PTR1 [Apostasia shenzhenica]|uniref:Peptide transporter PTR1 n=1 Tax=Apostasia shenzhenica TaxID=1088818 RepID=A0A2H9ZTD3_9ASPA|nr:Peptide transporter PTR1 [Apostasia shenzhenica]